jgi:hypothetical protein
MIKLVDLLKEIKEDYLNFLLEKIFNKGLDSLTSEEKQYLDQVSKGTSSKTPDEYLQDLFKEWKDEEIEAGNDIEDIYNWSDLHKFDQELQDGFLSYINLIKKYPNLDKKDLALINSLGHLKELTGAQVYSSYSDYDWNSVDEKTYHKIMFDEFGTYNPSDLSYKKLSKEKRKIDNPIIKEKFDILIAKAEKAKNNKNEIELQNIYNQGLKIQGGTENWWAYFINTLIDKNIAYQEGPYLKWNI